MSLGLLGRKIGMTEIFDDDGSSTAVSVVHVGTNYVMQVKTIETDGYEAVQLSYGERKASRVNKPQIGHAAKAGVPAGVFIKEFIVAADSFKLGQAVAVDIFNAGEKVDVQGTTIGKGYAGTIKRHHFASGRASHGNSRSHNVPGSIGQAQDPGRVFPGKRMTGHLGDVTRTVQNLAVIRVDVENGLLFIKGAIPGSENGFVVVQPAIKVSQKAQAVAAARAL